MTATPGHRHTASISDLDLNLPAIIQITDSKVLDTVLDTVKDAKADDPIKDTVIVSAEELSKVVSVLTEKVDIPDTFPVEGWDGKTLFSDYVKSGLEHLERDTSNIVMVFESPSSSSKDSSFFNSNVYKFHDYPPSAGSTKKMLGPCRYALVNGGTYPVFLAGGVPPKGLVEHWKATVPDVPTPTFVPGLQPESVAYAYLPSESIPNHVNDPKVHYHLAGKDALCFMTQKTTKILDRKQQQRPCVAKTTHSMASKGIFVIRNDEDEKAFDAFLQESGQPSYVVTEYVDICRNLACHFFIHPSGKIIWFGSNENYKDASGNWSMDSNIYQHNQEELKQMQLPFVQDIASYCLAQGFWGFCGIDVLFDEAGKGYLVDLNPRVTGSLPALLVSQLLKKQDGSLFQACLFRRNGQNIYHGSTEEMLAEVSAYNEQHAGKSVIVLFSYNEVESGMTKMNVGVYGDDLEDCRAVVQHLVREKWWYVCSVYHTVSPDRSSIFK